MRIAIVESDETERAVLKQTAVTAGHDCSEYLTGWSFLKSMHGIAIDLIIIDWRLPDFDGLDILRRVRIVLGNKIMVMLITSDDLEEQIVAGFMAGADDYMTKPTRRAELAARLHALTRRHRINAIRAGVVRDDVIDIGAYHLDLKSKIAVVHGRQVKMRHKEFELAALLFKNAGSLVTKESIGMLIWGRQIVATSRTLDTHVSRIRSKLAIRIENNVTLTTVQKRGYRLDVF